MSTPFGSRCSVGSFPANGSFSGAPHVLPASVDRTVTSEDPVLLPVRTMASKAPSLVGETVVSSQGVETLAPASIMAMAVVTTERTVQWRPRSSLCNNTARLPRLLQAYAGMSRTPFLSSMICGNGRVMIPSSGGQSIAAFAIVQLRPRSWEMAICQASAGTFCGVTSRRFCGSGTQRIPTASKSPFFS